MLAEKFLVFLTRTRDVVLGDLAGMNGTSWGKPLRDERRTHGNRRGAAAKILSSRNTCGIAAIEKGSMRIENNEIAVIVSRSPVSNAQ